MGVGVRTPTRRQRQILAAMAAGAALTAPTDRRRRGYLGSSRICQSTIRAMVNRGWIEGDNVINGDDLIDGPRIVYRITAAGRELVDKP